MEQLSRGEEVVRERRVTPGPRESNVQTGVGAGWWVPAAHSELHVLEPIRHVSTASSPPTSVSWRGRQRQRRTPADARHRLEARSVWIGPRHSYEQAPGPRRHPWTRGCDPAETPPCGSPSARASTIDTLATRTRRESSEAPPGVAPRRSPHPALFRHFSLPVSCCRPAACCPTVRTGRSVRRR